VGYWQHKFYVWTFDITLCVS